MEKPIVTALFIIVSMILVVMLFNAVYPAVQQGGEAVTSMANNVADRMRNQISVIHASAEFDDTGWCPDSNGNSTCDVLAWVKNIGQARIIGMDRMDVFFGPEDNYTRIPYSQTATGTYPYWSGSIEGGGDWIPTATMQIIIHYLSPPSAQRFYLKVTLPDGITSDYFLGISAWNM